MFSDADVGINPVTLTVTDNNGLTASCNATVTVELVEDLDIDGLTDVWEFDHFGDVTKHDSMDDPDNDGLDNTTEFNFDSDPKAYTLLLEKGWNLISIRRQRVNKVQLSNLIGNDISGTAGRVQET